MIPIRRRIALVLLNLGALLMILGGVSDIVLADPPPAWEGVVGAPLVTLPSGVTTLLLALLSALGTALIGCGVATLALINGPLRRGDGWSALVIVLVVVLSDGVNSLTMARLRLPYFWAPLLVVLLVLVGLAVAYVPTRVFGPGAPPD